MEQLLTVETRTVPALAGLESQFVMRRNRVTASWFPALISKRASMLRWDMPRHRAPPISDHLTSLTAMRRGADTAHRIATYLSLE